MANDDIIRELKEIKKMTLIQTKEFLSVSETAFYMDRSEETIRKMARQHLLPFTRPFGKEMYFRKSEINRILGSNEVPRI